MSRSDNKLQAMMDRGALIGSSQPVCDYCQHNPATDMHERIARSVTMGNEEARELSYQVELINLLCRTCHEEADGEGISKFLWEFSIFLYGRERVEAALSRLQEVMNTKLKDYLND